MNDLVTRLDLCVTRRFTKNIITAVHALRNDLLNNLVTRFMQPIESPSESLNGLRSGVH